MVRIRLRRMGAKKKPFYRIVVADKRSPRDGRFIETIGTYNPLTDPETVTLVHERAAHWLSVGAQPSDAVARLLKSRNLLDEAGKPIQHTEEALSEMTATLAAAAGGAVAAVAAATDTVVTAATDAAATVADAAEEIVGEVVEQVAQAVDVAAGADDQAEEAG